MYSSSSQLRLAEERGEKFIFERNITYFFFVIGALLNFVPQMAGQTLKDPITNEYPPYLDDLWSFEYVGGLVASLTAAAPILIDYAIDGLFFFFTTPTNSQILKTRIRLTYFIPFLEVFFYLVVPDIVILCYILPYQDYDTLPGLFGCRDTLYIFSFLSYMAGQNVAIWGLHNTIWIGIMFMITNWFSSVGVFVSDPTYEQSAQIVVDIALSIAFLLLGWTIFRWIRFCQNVTDKASQTRVLHNSVFVLCYSVFIINDWFSAYFPLPDESPWSLLGVNFLSLYSYLIALCTLAIIVVTFRVSRVESSDLKKREYDNLLALRRMFMRYISHEIRTPLNIVYLGLKVLNNELVDNPSGTEVKDSDYLSTIKDTQVSCDEAISILNDMLTYDKIENGILEVDLQPISPWALVQGAVVPFNEKAMEKGVSLVYKSVAESRPDELLNADGQKIRQMVRNLVSNALKFTPPGGSVTVSVDIVQNEFPLQNGEQMQAVTSSFSETSASTVLKVIPTEESFQITVQDTGIGISAENLDKLFRGVVQFNPGKLQDGGGSGLGLFITKGLVDLHKGTIRAMSEGEGKGSTFVLRLPLHRTVEFECRSDDDPEQGGVHGMWRASGNSGSPVASQTKLQGVSIHQIVVNIRNSIHRTMGFKEASVTPAKEFGHREAARFDDVLQGLAATSPDEETDRKEDAMDFESLLSGGQNKHKENDQREKDKEHKERDEEGNSNNSIPSEFDSAFGSLLSPLACNLLVVDDSKLNRKMTCKTIQQYRPSTHCDQAEDGLEALRLVKEKIEERAAFQSEGKDYHGDYDVIIMDYQMPVMDGPTAITEIRSLGYTGLIIGLTGNALNDDVQTMLFSGADKVLTKPLDITKLMRLIEPLGKRL